MGFQFQCPQGHLLEADDHDAGKTCTCPYCGVMIEIPRPTGVGPAPPAPAAPPAPVAAVPPPAALPPAEIPSGPSPAADFPPVVGRKRRKTASFNSLPDFSGDKADHGAESVDVTRKAELFHISCPNGHQLDVEREMLDQSALCPQCNVKFKLRERDSVEWKRKQDIREEQHERKVSNTWFNWAVAISVIVFVFLLALAMLSNK